MLPARIPAAVPAIGARRREACLPLPDRGSPISPKADAAPDATGVIPTLHRAIVTVFSTVTWSISETRTVAFIVQVPETGRLRVSLPQ